MIIKQISFVVEEIGEFIIERSQYGFVYLNNEDVGYWECDSADKFCDMTSSGFRKDFNEATGFRISEEEAVEIWQNVIMQYGFLTR